MKSCKEYALRYISRYPKTEKELTIKLYQKGYGSDEVQKIMNFLKEKNFVNDKMFAQSYINSEVSRKGKPLIQVRQKLRQKGIEKDILDRVIQESKTDIKDGIIARIHKEIKKYKKKGVNGFDIIQKLMRRGYPLDDIKYAIEEKNKNR